MPSLLKSQDQIDAMATVASEIVSKALVKANQRADALIEEDQRNADRDLAQRVRRSWSNPEESM